MHADDLWFVKPEETLNLCFHYFSSLQHRRLQNRRQGLVSQVQQMAFVHTLLHCIEGRQALPGNFLDAHAHVRCRHHLCNTWLLTTDRAVCRTVTV